MVTGVIKNKIDKIWTDIWAGGITNPLTVIEQLTYLMFIRSLDEKELENEEFGSVIKLLFNGKPVPIDKKTDNSRMNYLTFRETDSFTCKSFDSSPKCQMITFYLLRILLPGF